MNRNPVPSSASLVVLTALVALTALPGAAANDVPDGALPPGAGEALLAVQVLDETVAVADVLDFALDHLTPSAGTSGATVGALTGDITAGKACVWYEPGHRVGTPVVDVNYYMIQMPVPDADPLGVTPDETKGFAGTYFISLNFDGADCPS